jgi:hypothetical protein
MSGRLTSPVVAAAVPAPLRIATALCVIASGYLHAVLYLHGYRALPGVGPAFLLQAGGSFAVGILLLIAAPGILRLAAAALSVGTLLGFVLSRTVGIFGFIEHGLNPAPHAVLSLLCEAATLVLLALGPRLALSHSALASQQSGQRPARRCAS